MLSKLYTEIHQKQTNYYNYQPNITCIIELFGFDDLWSIKPLPTLVSNRNFVWNEETIFWHAVYSCRSDLTPEYSWMKLCEVVGNSWKNLLPIFRGFPNFSVTREMMKIWENHFWQIFMSIRDFVAWSFMCYWVLMNQNGSEQHLNQKKNVKVLRASTKCTIVLLSVKYSHENDAVITTEQMPRTLECKLYLCIISVTRDRLVNKSENFEENVPRNSRFDNCKS